jgi:hypothetical protein
MFNSRPLCLLVLLLTSNSVTSAAGDSMVEQVDMGPGETTATDNSQSDEGGDFQLHLQSEYGKGLRGVEMSKDAASSAGLIDEADLGRRLIFGHLVDLGVEVGFGALTDEDKRDGSVLYIDKIFTTRDAVKQCLERFPESNCVIINRPHTVTGDGYYKERLRVSGQWHWIDTFTLYISKRGNPFFLSFTGDGGYKNWSYGGGWDRVSEKSIRAIEYQKLPNGVWLLPMGVWNQNVGFCNWGSDGTGASSKCEGGKQGGDWCNVGLDNCMSGCGGRWCMGIGPHVPFVSPSGPTTDFCNWGSDGTGASSTCAGGAQGGDYCNASKGNCESGCGGKWC